MKAIAKSATDIEVSEAVEELRESVRNVITAMENVAKRIDWESVAPKIVMGLMVVYGLRNRKLLSTIISSIVIGMITKRVSAATQRL